MVLPDRWVDTELIRYESRAEPAWGVFLLLLLAIGMLGMGAVFAAGILGFVQLAPAVLGALLGLQFVNAGVITIVYFKLFLPYLVIARDEHPEDVLW